MSSILGPAEILGKSTTVLAQTLLHADFCVELTKTLRRSENLTDYQNLGFLYLFELNIEPS